LPETVASVVAQKGGLHPATLEERGEPRAVRLPGPPAEPAPEDATTIAFPTELVDLEIDHDGAASALMVKEQVATICISRWASKCDLATP